MRIAITGPTGAIGTALIKEAISAGHEVIAIVRPGSSRMSNVAVTKGVEIIECDISDYASLHGKRQCDVFFHLAWMKTFGVARDDVYSQVDNIRYALNAVDLAESWGAKAFVGAGSQAEYGHSEVSLNGSVPVDPTSGYGIAKYSAGKLCRLFCQQKGIRFNWARILSVYGENDADHTLIMYLIHTLLEGGVPELTKCEQMWDYIYSKDAAYALLCIGEKGVDGKVYCIGSGECRPLKAYVEDLRDAVDPSKEVRFGVKPYYPHQAMYLCADISELTADTGFRPRYGFKKGISELIGIIRQG